MVGGSDACIVRPHSMPWTVNLHVIRQSPNLYVSPYEVFHNKTLGAPPNPYGTHCGGTLVSKNLVLTAQHCGVSPASTVAMIGEHNVEDRNDQQIIGIKKNIPYPHYAGVITDTPIHNIYVSKN